MCNQIFYFLRLIDPKDRNDTMIEQSRIEFRSIDFYISLYIIFICIYKVCGSHNINLERLHTVHRQQFHHFWHVYKIVINYLFNLERSISLLCIIDTIISDNRQLMYHCYLVMIQFSYISPIRIYFKIYSRMFRIIRLKKDGTSV